MQSAARAAEKSWRRLLREDDRGQAGLRSDPNPFEAERWTAQGEIIWNTTGDSGRFTKDDGDTALVTKALPLNGEILGHRFALARARATDALSS
jgi:hypothetical protein